MIKKRKLNRSSAILVAGGLAVLAPLLRVATGVFAEPAPFRDGLEYRIDQVTNWTGVRGSPNRTFTHVQDEEAIRSAKKYGWTGWDAPPDDKSYLRITKQGRSIRYAEDALASNRYAVPPVLEDIHIVKTWTDDDDRDGIRPTSVNVTLQIKLEGEGDDQWRTATYDNCGYTAAPYPALGGGFASDGRPVRPDGQQPLNVSRYSGIPDPDNTSKWADPDDNWHYWIRDLNTYWKGKKVQYRLVETALPVQPLSRAHTSYTPIGPVDVSSMEVSDDARVKEYYAVLRNNHIPDRIDLAGTKTWDDQNNRDYMRPQSIYVSLYADGQLADAKNSGYTGPNPIRVDAQADGGPSGAMANKWTFSFNNLYRYRDHGARIVYTTTEQAIPDRERPNADDKGTHMLSYSPLGETDFRYTVSTANDKTSGNMTAAMTNTHNPILIPLTFNKVWLDENNNDGYRPSEVKYRVFANGVEITNTNKHLYLHPTKAAGVSFPLVLKAGENWTKTVDGFYKYDNPSANTNTNNSNGREIVYTHEEMNDYPNSDRYNRGGGVDILQGRKKTPKGNGWDLTSYNPHSLDKVSITIDKAWNDGTNQDNYRRRIAIQFLLMSDESEAGQFRPVADQQPLIVEIGNTRQERTIAQRSSAAANTVVNGSQADRWIISEAFVGLPRYKQGRKIRYQIVESVSSKDGANNHLKYQSPAPVEFTLGSATDPHTGPVYIYQGGFTNTHIPDKMSFILNKTWDDGNNNDGYRKDMTLTFELFSDVGSAGTFTSTGRKETVTIDSNGTASRAGGQILYSGNTWKLTNAFGSGMPRFAREGRLIRYRVKETISNTTTGNKYYVSSGADGFSTVDFAPVAATITPNANTGDTYEASGTVTNRHVPEKISIDLTKTWVDNFDTDYVRGEVRMKFILERSLDGANWTTAAQSGDVVFDYATKNMQGRSDAGNPSSNWVTGANGTTAGQSYFFKDFFWNLPRYQNGRKIQYRVREVLASNRTDGWMNYRSSGGGTTESANEGDIRRGAEYSAPTKPLKVTVWNDHDPDQVRIVVSKVWQDKFSHAVNGSVPGYVYGAGVTDKDDFFGQRSYVNRKIVLRKYVGSGNWQNVDERTVSDGRSDNVVFTVPKNTVKNSVYQGVDPIQYQLSEENQFKGGIKMKYQAIEGRVLEGDVSIPNGSGGWKIVDAATNPYPNTGTGYTAWTPGFFGQLGNWSAEGTRRIYAAAARFTNKIETVPDGDITLYKSWGRNLDSVGFTDAEYVELKIEVSYDGGAHWNHISGWGSDNNQPYEVKGGVLRVYPAAAKNNAQKRNEYTHLRNLYQVPFYAYGLNSQPAKYRVTEYIHLNMRSKVSFSHISGVPVGASVSAQIEPANWGFKTGQVTFNNGGSATFNNTITPPYPKVTMNLNPTNCYEVTIFVNSVLKKTGTPEDQLLKFTAWGGGAKGYPLSVLYRGNWTYDSTVGQKWYRPPKGADDIVPGAFFSGETGPYVDQKYGHIFIITKMLENDPDGWQFEQYSTNWDLGTHVVLAKGKYVSNTKAYLQFPGGVGATITNTFYSEEGHSPLGWITPTEAFRDKLMQLAQANNGAGTRLQGDDLVWGVDGVGLERDPGNVWIDIKAQ